MRILLLDIETCPTLAYVWKLIKETIGINQVVKEGHTISYAAKWVGKPKVYFDSIHKSGMKGMLQSVRALLDEADVVVHWNGKSFDTRTLNKDFIVNKVARPSPYKQVDLFLVWKRNFRSISNKLQHVLKMLGLGEKIKTDFDLWKAVLNGDRKAWQKMEAYNKNDTVKMEPVYKRLLPWIANHPNHGLFTQKAVCPNCGSEKHQSRGYAYTESHVYRRFQCGDCSTWFRSNAVEKKFVRPQFKGL